jgi:hypothetical protein
MRRDEQLVESGTEVSAALSLLQSALSAHRTRLGQEIAGALERSDRERFHGLTAVTHELLKLEEDAAALERRWMQLGKRDGGGRSRAEEASPVEPEPGNAAAFSLAALAAEPLRTARVIGTRPTAVILPDGVELPVNRWNVAAVAVVEWLGARKTLCVPFAGRARSRQWFLNRTPFHSDGAPFDAGGRRRIQYGAQEVWVDTHRSAPDLIRCLARLLEACGQAAGSVRVRFRRSSDPRGGV